MGDWKGNDVFCDQFLMRHGLLKERRFIQIRITLRAYFLPEVSSRKTVSTICGNLKQL